MSQTVDLEQRVDLVILMDGLVDEVDAQEREDVGLQ